MSCLLQLGIDVGSTTVKLCVLDEDCNIVYSDYKRHFSDIKLTVSELLSKADKALFKAPVRISVTGSGGLLLSKLLDLPFVQEVIATRTAIRRFIPDADVVIELGGEDAKILYLTDGAEQRMNGTCAGGTGAFIDQMATLLRTDAKGLDELASRHGTIYPIAARCGVFAKSDIQPLLNEGAAKEDIAASVFQSVVTQTISGLAQGRPIRGKVVLLGGPLYFLPQLAKQFEEALCGEGNTFVRPQNAQLFIATGAALSANGQAVSLSELCNKLEDSSQTHTEITRIAPLFESDKERADFYARHSMNKVKRNSLESVQGGLFLGLDVGSTTVKLAVINENEELLYSDYSPNEGSPVDCGAKMLSGLYSVMPENAYIANACATGYGEALAMAAFNIPEGEIETIAHYKAASRFCPKVDFIIDIGGQDMKCMRIKNGVIDSIMINEACSSGCGSFIQTFAESLEMDPPSFAHEAMFAKNPVDLGTRCTVFMNSRVKQAQKEGATVGDISAGLSYSVVRNALYKVIRLRDPALIGDTIVVQGGTFCNDSVLRCFELVSQKKVIRPDIAGIMGAFGAALIAKERYGGGRCEMISSDELNGFSYKTTMTNCTACTNSCLLTISKFKNTRTFVSGNRCERFSGVQGSGIDELPNLYDYKYRRVFDYKSIHPDIAKRGVIGIPRVLNIYENYPLWHTFFTFLGFSVHLSADSSHDLYKTGMDTIPSESVCYPAKLAHGHVANLISRGIKTIFYPCIPYEQREYKDAGNHFNCPIVTSYPEVIYNNMDSVKKDGVRFLHPFLTLENRRAFVKSMYKALMPFEVTYIEVRRAAKAAFAELARFKEDIHKKGEETLSWLDKNGKKGIVLAGRPYHIDPEINHGIPRMINSLGFAVLTEDSVAHLGDLKRPIRIVDQWAYHTRLYHAAQCVNQNPRLELVQLNSFGCGLDAVTTDQVAEILSSHSKLYTALKIDEISSLGTAKIRIRSLKAAIEERSKNGFIPPESAPYSFRRRVFMEEMKSRHTVIFPQMSPIHFKLLEAVLRANGYNAMVLETVSAGDVEAGLKHVNNDACYPSILVTGQIINAFISGKCDPKNTSVFITQTGGGCRATNYIAFIRKALCDAGYPDIPVVSLNVSRLESNPGFKITPCLFDRSIKALVLGDLLLTLLLRVRPYETKKGSADLMLESWLLRLALDLPQKGFDFKGAVDSIISDFDGISAEVWDIKPRVGIVGEILVKFHPGANNNAIRVVEDEGAEAVMPGLIDFLMYCFYNSNFKSNVLGKNRWGALASNIIIWLLENYRRYMKERLLKNPRFAPYAPKHITSLAKSAKSLLQLGNITGEGWFLTAEMIELIESGVPNIICVQPFACLPNHVTGKGVIKELRRRYPQANIVAIDYDPGASEVNQINRIKLMMSIAFENTEDERERIIRTAQTQLML
ncbi:MAG: Activator of (R)-2-hydroxyglutaryl-CoA dehydratase [Firmicutes bacterium ADurb.Bin193]|nr:MAG: Activator of (R)-2-hydroxyglutaryl-CoA dehydratase [Firmicutes bacterium ADurb.Bin193]